MPKPTIAPGTELKFIIYFSKETFISILATAENQDILADGNYQFNWDLRNPNKPLGTNKRKFVTLRDWLNICEVLRKCKDPEIDWVGIGNYIFMTDDDMKMPPNFLSLLHAD